jgi:hypothetical protein
VARATWWTCEQVQRRESRAFGTYLSLPVEEYALLDPSLIERIDADSFRLAVPLGDIFADLGFGGGERGAFRLIPQIVIRVEIDADSRQVTFVGDEAGLGYAPLDERFDVQVCSQVPLASRVHVPKSTRVVYHGNHLIAHALYMCEKASTCASLEGLLKLPRPTLTLSSAFTGGGKVQTRARKRSNVHSALAVVGTLKYGIWAP